MQNVSWYSESRGRCFSENALLGYLLITLRKIRLQSFIKVVIVKFLENEKRHLVMIFEVLEEMPNSTHDCLFKNVLEHFLTKMF